MTPAQFLARVKKKDIPQVILFLGQEGYNRRRCRDAVVAALGIEPEQIDMAESSLAAVVDDARAILQTLDPAGVGARDLAECLRLQMHAAGQLDDVAEVCLEHLDLVASKQWQKLADFANRKGGDGGIDVEEVRLAIAAIQDCNPKPAAGFGTVRVDSVVPS